MVYRTGKRMRNATTCHNMHDSERACAICVTYAAPQQLAFLPTVVLAARVCPRGVEASVYALFLSTVDVAAVVSDFSAAGMARFFGVSKYTWKGLPAIIVLCNVLRPLPLLLWFRYVVGGWV
jgi:hypothetical protein